MTVDATEIHPVAIARKLQQDHLILDRLIVLIPNQGLDSCGLARRIWTLAGPANVKVLFLGLAGPADSEEEDARLRLATLAAMTRDDSVPVETHVEIDDSWLRAIHRIWQPGDAVICLAEQTIRLPLYGSQPLSQVIECALDVPVYVISGLYAADRARRRDEAASIDRAVTSFKRLLVPVLIVIGFLCIQLQVDLATAGATRTALLAALVLAEIGVIGVWSAIVH